MNNKLVTFLITGIIIAVSVAGVAYALTSQQDKSGSQPSQADAVMTNTVEITSYKYGPETITVKKGTKVTWINKDTVKHTVTTQEGAPASIDSGMFGNGESYSFTFTQTGTYDYFCEPHPYMKGTVVVTE